MNARKTFRRFVRGTALAAVAFSSVAAYALSSLMDVENAPVTFLYTQRTIIPNLVFRLSAVPLAYMSRVKYGRPALHVAGITNDEVSSAFRSSEILIVGTHGNEDGFATDDGGMKLVGPESSVYPRMKTLFFGSCNVGRKLPEWQREFPNAKIVSFTREMMEYEGWLYLVFGAGKDLFR